MAALEAALLDLLGKALNVPVCELLGPGKQRDAVTVLGYLFYVGDRTKTDLPYLAQSPGNHDWYQLRHQQALTRDAVVRPPRRLRIATASKISSSRVACCPVSRRLKPPGR